MDSSNKFEKFKIPVPGSKASLISAVAVMGMLWSCENGHQAAVEEIDFAGCTSVRLDSIPVNAVINPMSMAVAGDRLVVAGKSDSTVLTVFTLPRLDSLTYLGRTGHGPEELISPGLETMRSLDETSVYLMSGVPATVYTVDVNRQSVDTRQFRLPSEWGYAQLIVPYGKDSFFAQNGTLPMEWSFLDGNGKERFSIEPSVPEEADRKAGDNDIRKMFLRTSFGDVNQDRERFVVSYRNLASVAIYDIEGNLIKEIRYPHEIEPDDLWIINTYPTDAALYVNYHDPGDNEYTHSVMLSIDWDGNVTGKYRVPKAVGPFCVDPRSKTVYFFGAGDDDNIYSFTI